jgi:glutamine amidotransferase
VQGHTDSERVFALITSHARQNGGDIGQAITTAARFIAATLPLYALNIILATPTDLWALRYPATHTLYVLHRQSGGARGGRHFDAASAAGTVRVRSRDLIDRPAVVIASEPMDEDSGWHPVKPGELIHVSAHQAVTRTRIINTPPAHQLTLADLDPTAARSQTGEPSASPR